MAIILITGASRGIGRATAELLAQQGHTVYGTSRDPDGVVIHNVRVIRLDVTSEGSALAAVQNVVGKSGRLDVLINNAGISQLGALEEISLIEAQTVFDTNVFGVMRMVKQALPIMRAQGDGKIINVSSIAGIIAVPFQGIYSASKYAIEGYTESLRHEVKHLGIDVSLIQPGDINTTIQDTVSAKIIDAYAKQRANFLATHAKSMKEAPSAEIVAKTIARVVKTRKPKLRYAVGKEAFLPTAKRFIPNSFGEMWIRRWFKLDQD